MLAVAGLITIVHSGTLCSSFSRSVTPPWRSQLHPLGVPGLAPKAQQKVDVGNTLAVPAAALLQAFDASGAVVSNKKPRESWQWQHPRIKEQKNKVLQVSVALDYCTCCTPWKKPTLIRGNRRWLCFLERRCTCVRHAATLRGTTVTSMAGESRAQRRRPSIRRR